MIAAATEGSLAGPHAGNRDIYLARHTSGGDEIWKTQIGGEGSDSPLGLSVAPDDSIYVGGYTDGSFAGENQGSADIWLARFDGAGIELWRRQLGGAEWDRGFDVTAFDGGAYITGYTASVLDESTDLEGFDGFAARFDVEGTLEWVIHVGSDATDWGQGSSLAPDGGLYMTGYTEGLMGETQAGDKDAFVTRISPTGDIVWTQQFGTAELDWPQGVGTTADGGVIVAGSTAGGLDGPNAGDRDAFVAAFDQNGGHLFTTQFGTPELDYVFEVRAVENGFVATGSTAGDLNGSHGDRDGLLVWFDEAGNVDKIEQRGSDAVDDLTGLDVSETGDVFFSGGTFGDFAGGTAGDSDLVIGAVKAPADG